MQAREELAKLGPMSTDEKLTAFAFAITIGLWIFGGSVGISAVAAALTGLSILLITGALGVVTPHWLSLGMLVDVCCLMSMECTCIVNGVQVS